MVINIILNKIFKHKNLNLYLTLFSILIAIIFGAFGIYSTYYGDQSEISYDILNEVNVLDVHKPLEDLTVSFQNEDIQKKNLNLRIMTIRIKNSGQTDILQNHYDKNDVWGFQIKNGKIIEVRLLDSNSDYLKSNLNPNSSSDNIVQFEQIIFEKGKYTTLEILLLHEKNMPPEIIPIGKIAGIDEIIVTKLADKDNQILNGYISDIFHGNIFIHIVRFFIYMIIFSFSIIIFALIVDKISEIDENEKYKKRIKQTGLITSPEKYTMLIHLYNEIGKYPILFIKYVLDNENIDEKMKEWSQKQAHTKWQEHENIDIDDLVKNISGMRHQNHQNIMDLDKFDYDRWGFFIIYYLIRNEKIKMRKYRGASIDSEFVRNLNEFCGFIDDWG